MKIEEELGFQFWCDYTNQSSQVPALSMDRVVMDLRRWRASWLLGITSCFFRQDIERDRILPTPTISEIFQVHLLLFLPPLSKDHFPCFFLKSKPLVFRNTIFHCPPTVSRPYTRSSGTRKQTGECRITKRYTSLVKDQNDNKLHRWWPGWSRRGWRGRGRKGRATHMLSTRSDFHAFPVDHDGRWSLPGGFGFTTWLHIVLK